MTKEQLEQTVGHARLLLSGKQELHPAVAEAFRVLSEAQYALDKEKRDQP